MPVAGIKVLIVGRTWPLPSYEVRHLEQASALLTTIAQKFGDRFVMPKKR